MGWRGFTREKRKERDNGKSYDLVRKNPENSESFKRRILLQTHSLVVVSNYAKILCPIGMELT